MFFLQGLLSNATDGTINIVFFDNPETKSWKFDENASFYETNEVLGWSSTL